ncbi:5-formyltetrahydrofolate cyclo-ligase [Rhodopila sp.]|uniref:5-formyltetrahydrofolate cyclo-ligase n=1 Tax=Rhodopila sp. TaxID=2480087 RepID=UPI003D0F471A
MTNELGAAKRAARESALRRRLGLDGQAAGRALAGHVLGDFSAGFGPGVFRSGVFGPGVRGNSVSAKIVSGFWPIGDEIDIRPLLHALHDRGCKIALPVTPRRGEALTFRAWHPGDVLVAERFGTMRPIGEEVVPDMLLVPLLAFDVAGGRLGYGGGFYDRTLAALPDRFRLGCGFAAQQVDAVPIGPYDMRLDAVATENGIIRCGS